MKYLVTGLISLALSVGAFAQDTYKVRLRPVPVDGQTQRVILGNGQATATLTGTKLTVNGTFEGLQSAASAVKIHMGSKMGVRGNPILDLTATKSQAGAISGTVDLNPMQVEALKAGRLYIQIDADKAPDGNLWGWLTK